MQMGILPATLKNAGLDLTHITNPSKSKVGKCRLGGAGNITPSHTIMLFFIRKKKQNRGGKTVESTTGC